MIARLTLNYTEVAYRVTLGNSDDWDASLRESVKADGAVSVRAQFFLQPTGYNVADFTTRAEALAWLQEQYAAEHSVVSA